MECCKMERIEEMQESLQEIEAVILQEVMNFALLIMWMNHLWKRNRTADITVYVFFLKG